ncbi:MAG: hypothetical protein M4579_002722 [Chaenotheca gracillima]|nr:MAG: hypothetical protein M4579_002722 [Chaenotheca gracillima]
MPSFFGESPIPTVRQLEKPEDMKGLVKEDNYDCLSCKIIGGSSLVGLGAYSYFSGRHQLRQQQAAILKSGSRFGMKSRQAGITSIAISLVGMGLWRFLN